MVFMPSMYVPYTLYICTTPWNKQTISHIKFKRVENKKKVVANNNPTHPDIWLVIYLYFEKPHSFFAANKQKSNIRIEYTTFWCMNERMCCVRMCVCIYQIPECRRPHRQAHTGCIHQNVPMIYISWTWTFRMNALHIHSVGVGELKIGNRIQFNTFQYSASIVHSFVVAAVCVCVCVQL